MNYRKTKKMWTKYRSCSCGHPISIRLSSMAYKCRNCGKVFQVRCRPACEPKVGKVLVAHDGKFSRLELGRVVRVIGNSKTLRAIQRKVANETYWLNSKRGQRFILARDGGGHYFIAGETLYSGWYGLSWNYSVDVSGIQEVGYKDCVERKFCDDWLGIIEERSGEH